MQTIFPDDLVPVDGPLGTHRGITAITGQLFQDYAPQCVRGMTVVRKFLRVVDLVISNFF